MTESMVLFTSTVAALAGVVLLFDFRVDLAWKYSDLPEALLKEAMFRRS